MQTQIEDAAAEPSLGGTSGLQGTLVHNVQHHHCPSDKIVYRGETRTIAYWLVPPETRRASSERLVAQRL